MRPLTGKRLQFRFADLEAMSAFLRRLRPHGPDALVEAAKAHFGSFTVSTTLFLRSDGAAVRKEATELGGTEFTA